MRVQPKVQEFRPMWGWEPLLPAHWPMFSKPEDAQELLADMQKVAPGVKLGDAQHVDWNGIDTDESGIQVSIDPSETARMFYIYGSVSLPSKDGATSVICAIDEWAGNLFDRKSHPDVTQDKNLHAHPPNVQAPPIDPAKPLFLHFYNLDDANAAAYWSNEQ